MPLSGSRFDLTRNPSQNNKMNIFICLLRVFGSAKNWHIILPQPRRPRQSYYDLIMRLKICALCSGHWSFLATLSEKSIQLYLECQWNTYLL